MFSLRIPPCANAAKKRSLVAGSANLLPNSAIGKLGCSRLTSATDWLDKIHLFAFDNSRERYDDGRVLEAGSEPVAFTAGSGIAAHRVGRALAFDASGQACNLMCEPAAFTCTTGQAHWGAAAAGAGGREPVLRHRAGTGRHPRERPPHLGHSLIVDPWGEVLAVREEGEGVVLAELDAQRLAGVRAQLPALRHRGL